MIDSDTLAYYIEKIITVIESFTAQVLNTGQERTLQLIFCRFRNEEKSINFLKKSRQYSQ